MVAALRTYQGQARLKPDNALAIACLRQSRRLGFNRKTEAEAVPDFEHLVKGNQKVQKSFQEAFSETTFVSR